MRKLLKDPKQLQKKMYDTNSFRADSWNQK